MCKQKEGRQRGTWNGKKADNEFYKKIVCSLIGLFIFLQPLHVWFLPLHYSQVDTYEAKNQELIAENADLKALLRSMQVMLIIIEVLPLLSILWVHDS